MQFVKPNALHRPGLAVGEDHGLPTRSVSACSKAPRIVDARTFAASEGNKSSGSKWSVSLIRTAVRRQIQTLQLSVFLIDYGQSDIRRAAFNEQISHQVRLASYRKSDS
jgi:hypothetical protein